MMRRPTNATSAQWTAADRCIDVVLARDAGLSFTTIGRKLGISSHRVRQLYQRGRTSSVARWRWLERVIAFNQRLVNIDEIHVLKTRGVVDFFESGEA